MEASGTIFAQVYTSRAQIPIVYISTPNFAEGTFPGGQTPFALCDIWAHSPGFELLVAEDVQVFSNTETFQALELIPLPEQTPFRSRTEVLHNTPQNL